MTPSEVLQFDCPDADPLIVKLVQPAILFPLEPFTNPRDKDYRIAMPAEARIKKRGPCGCGGGGVVGDPGVGR